AAVVRAAVAVFLLCVALISAVVFTLDLNARRSNRQEVATELAGMARVSSSTFSTMRANLRARVGELAGSARLPQAGVPRHAKRLRALAVAHDARLVVHGRAYGVVPRGPHIAATATMAQSGRVVARLAMAVPIDRSFLSVLASATPMPTHAALVLAQNG